MVENSAAEIEAMRETLRKAADEGPPSRNLPRTKAEKIRMLRSEIAVLRAKGWKWQEVADALADQLDASADTIRLAIGETKKQPRTKRISSVENKKMLAVTNRAAAEGTAKEAEPTRAWAGTAPEIGAAVKNQPNSDRQFGARKL